MIEEKIEKIEEIKPVSGHVNNDLDFWTMANDFAKSVLNPETEKMFTDYCTKFELNNNEIQFLRLMTKQALDFPIMMASLKLRCK